LISEIGGAPGLFVMAQTYLGPPLDTPLMGSASPEGVSEWNNHIKKVYSATNMIISLW